MNLTVRGRLSIRIVSLCDLLLPLKWTVAITSKEPPCQRDRSISSDGPIYILFFRNYYTTGKANSKGITKTEDALKRSLFWTHWLCNAFPILKVTSFSIFISFQWTQLLSDSYGCKREGDGGEGILWEKKKMNDQYFKIGKYKYICDGGKSNLESSSRHYLYRSFSFWKVFDFSAT